MAVALFSRKKAALRHLPLAARRRQCKLTPVENAAKTFRTVPEILTGCGCVRRIGAIAAPFGARGVIATGATSGTASGAVEAISASFGECGIEYEILDRIKSEPTVGDVDAIRKVMREAEACFVVGVGGGSAMDAAKAAAGLAREGEPTAVFLHEAKEARPGVPLITVPTTSGSGAEVTPNAVITDPESDTKQSIRNGSYLPAVAIVDPQLTVSCPPRVTAHSGADALTQAIEAFVSLNATALTDALSCEAARLLWGNLERAYADGADLEARTACSYGSLMAGIALSNARLGAVHGMAHPVGVRLGAPHGLVCAVLLAEVVRANLPFAREKYARLEEITGPGLPERLEALNERLGLYGDLAAYPLADLDFAVIAQESMPSGSLKANPKKFDKEDVINVLERLAAR